jgi:hypothetical protein
MLTDIHIITLSKILECTNLEMFRFLFQDDMHIVNSLEIPTDDQKYIEDLVESRNWGPSVLIVYE